MTPEEDKKRIKERLHEKSAWDEIVNSNGWYVLLKLIKERQKSLQKKANKAIREGNTEEAGKKIAIMDEYDILVNRASERIKNFNKGED